MMMRMFRWNRLLPWVILVLVFFMVLTCFNFYMLMFVPPASRDVSRMVTPREVPPNHQPLFPRKDLGLAKVRYVGNSTDSGHLSHIMKVFERVGYERVEGSNWDVLWVHGSPFTRDTAIKDELLNLKPHQRVNHFPGAGVFVSKVKLVTEMKIPGIPPAFKMPSEKDKLLEYARSHPEAKWVQKGNSHRGIKLVSVDELDFNTKQTFIQQYVDDPLLIEGRRFDIGIYVTITSINPLRVYMNEPNWNVRFCPKKYLPFDPSDTDTYVVKGNHASIWEVLKPVYEDLGYSPRDSLFANLRGRGYNVDKLENDAKALIRSVLLESEESMSKAALEYKSSRNFFELVRFDFMVDSSLNLFLTEVNLSPSMSTVKKTKRGNMMQQLMFHMLNMLGVGQTTTKSFSNSTLEEQDMQVSYRDIDILADHCVSEQCKHACQPYVCQLCAPCLTVEQKTEMKRAYLEHTNRGQWRRVLPIAFTDQASASEWTPDADSGYQKLSFNNQLMFLWFRGKCIDDPTWCL